jgi:type VI secretion system protein ImpL
VLSFFKLRTLLLLISLVLIGTFIWVAGPYFAFGYYRPLETETARIIAIVAIIGTWLLWRLFKRFRARLASGQLMAAVVRQPKEDPVRPSADAAKLRARFEEAVAALGNRKDGRSLYDLPWYVFIGAPGSGKTTALINSGLKFPLENRVGKAAVRGVGGTRNCDWWFTDEAIFLDTAGRYTTQDSDAATDSEGWKEFLSLLSKYRARRPVNGVVLTISVEDLLTQGEEGREAHVDAARNRLAEFTETLRLQVPVYLLVTKCDMVAGFAESFDDLTQDRRAQVWGVTFPYEQSLNNEAPDVFADEFDALMERLNERVLDRVEAERGSRRRAMIFAFPSQMSGLREPLAQFVADVFSTSSTSPQVLLRGVYFTSGTQDGSQIDRLLGAVGRRFGMAAEAVPAPAAGRGKAFFVETLLKHVIIGESGLAGVNRRLEFRNAAWHFGLYAAILVLVAIGVLAFTLSYSSNRTYLAQVAADAATLQKVPPANSASSVQAALTRLNAVRAVFDSANRYRDQTPWGMRWGLFQGSSLGDAASDAYVRELEGVLLPRFAARMKQRLTDSSTSPENLYTYLKAYLMLDDRNHFDKKYLQEIADAEWKMSDAAPAAGTSLANHFRNLLEESEGLPPVGLDQALIAQARSTIRSASIPKIMYDQVKRDYSADSARALHFDQTSNALEKVFRRRSGRRLSEPFPSIYTVGVFKEITSTDMVALVKRFADDQWVWGTSVSAATWPQLTAQFTDVYERDYITAWSDLLDDLEVVPFATVQQYGEALGIIVSPNSPLRSFLKTVVANTSFVPQSDASTSTLESLKNKATDAINQARKKITGANAPGIPITQHFQPLHVVTAGAPAPIDPMFEQVRKIRDQLVKVGSQVGGTTALSTISDPLLLDLRRVLKQDAATLPRPLNVLFEEMAGLAGGVVIKAATGEIEQHYEDEVLTRCRLLVQDRYPLGIGQDITLADFGEVFGYGGLFDKFFNERLKGLVEVSPRGWEWRPESVVPSAGTRSLLAQLERADRIRQMFFTQGSKMPELAFTVRLSGLDSAATRFYLDIDDQRTEVKPGAPGNFNIQWPGKQGYVRAVFEDNVAAPDTIWSRQTPWALFKVIDENRADGSSAALRFRSKYHTAQASIEAPPVRNPFTSTDWRQFRCDP